MTGEGSSRAPGMSRLGHRAAGPAVSCLGPPTVLNSCRTLCVFLAELPGQPVVLQSSNPASASGDLRAAWQVEGWRLMLALTH